MRGGVIDRSTRRLSHAEKECLLFVCYMCLHGILVYDMIRACLLPCACLFCCYASVSFLLEFVICMYTRCVFCYVQREFFSF